MNVLAITLTVGVMFSDASEKAVSEVEETLNLQGKWEGIWWVNKDTSVNVKITGQMLRIVDKSDSSLPVVFEVVQERRGVIRVKVGASDYHGIYKWQGDRLVLCLSYSDVPRPRSFRAGGGQELMILRQVKYPK